MKMKTNKYLTMAVTALMMAACSSEDVPQVDSVTNTPIRIHAMVAELKSRAGIDDNTDFSQFYLSVKNSSNSNYSYSNVQVTKSGSGWEPTSPMYWQNSTTEVTVTAATFSLDGARDLAVQTDQSTDTNVKLSDHLYMEEGEQTYAEVESVKAAGAINVNFSHLMSKVNLTITLADEFYATENPISDVTFQGTVDSRNYNAGTWTDIDGVTATDIIPFEDAYTAPTQANPNATATYEVILVPQTISSGFAIQFKIGNRMFKWTSTGEVELDSGKQYTLALTAGDDKVSGASFSSTAWGDGGNNNVATE